MRGPQKSIQFARGKVPSGTKPGCKKGRNTKWGGKAKQNYAQLRTRRAPQCGVKRRLARGVQLKVATEKPPRKERPATKSSSTIGHVRKEHIGGTRSPWELESRKLNYKESLGKRLPLQQNEVDGRERDCLQEKEVIKLINSAVLTGKILKSR